MHIIKPAFVLFIIAVIITALLSGVHTLTLEPIAEQARKTQEAAMREVLPEASEFKDTGAEASGNIVRIYEGLSGGQTAGYVVELEPDGYSGTINMMVGISAGENMITGMRVLKHSETPGLGALAAKENFYRQYDDRHLVPLNVVKTRPGENDIDALTSATITTRAITEAVNEAIEWYNGGGGR